MSHLTSTQQNWSAQVLPTNEESAMPQKVDILICGSGSAGLCAALWLSHYKVACTIIDSRLGPLERGQADGVQCRTVEVFDSFNIAEELLREAYHCLEVAFWAADGDFGIARTKRTADTAPGLSHQPHVILNQARVNGLMIEAMARANGQVVSYGYDVQSVEVDSTITGDDEDAYPVTVHTEKDGKDEVFQAKYVLGCDGAHSAVRRSLGIRMLGDTQNSIWGVMDIYPHTTFPDIRKKCIIHSSTGSLFIIPREGGSLARFYIQLPPGTVAKEVTLEQLYTATKRIFRPYEMEFAGCYWWSAYSIGQRLAESFEKERRVFLLGDACHTHSPKAGQGMNTSLQDGYNIGWKLASILKRQASPSILQTYDLERGKVAADLIAFDRQITRMLAEKDDEKENGDVNGSDKSKKFTDMFIKTARYMAGLTATYEDSSLTCARRSRKELARKVEVGMRLATTQIVRWCDAKAVQLIKALPADGRWRILVFAGNILSPISSERLFNLAECLGSKSGPIKTFIPDTDDVDSFIETLVVFSGKRTEVEMEQIPGIFFPVNGKWRMRDLHKVFFDDESYNSGHGRAYEFYGIDVQNGAVVIVRPDQYVSMITAVDDHKGIGDFFAGFALPRT